MLHRHNTNNLFASTAEIPKNTQDYIFLPISGGELYSLC
jgi:hypothetical protein